MISIAIATFNSAKTLERTLQSIRKQTYPQEKIEVMVIDGGSTDQTINIAKKYKCRIIPNSKTDLIYAKHIGFLKARGQYLMYLDSDEVLENRNSLKIKLSAFKKDVRVRAVMLSGYKTPKEFSDINYYSNEFGEPFSFFIYRESKGDGFLFRSWSEKYNKVYDDKKYAIFDFYNTNPLPIVELWAGGCMIDLKYARSTFPQVKKNPALLAHLFYLLNQKN